MADTWGGGAGIWVLAFEGRLWSNEDGTARAAPLAVESFGLMVGQALGRRGRPRREQRHGDDGRVV